MLYQTWDKCQYHMRAIFVPRLERGRFEVIYPSFRYNHGHDLSDAH